MKSKIVKWLVGFLIAIGIVVALIFTAFQVSPVPGAMVIAHMFGKEMPIQDPEAFEKTLDKVDTLIDVTYPSKYGRNQLDIYYPKASTTPHPVVFWVHGGGYVGGDKSGMKEFAHYLVDRLNVAVVAVNYEHAPKLTYPGQVVQMDESIAFLLSNQSQYPMLDMSKLAFGGDSAGAQISAQYVMLQVNQPYAQSMAMTPRLQTEAIKAYLSFCGPLDLVQMQKVEPTSGAMRFFMNTVGWSWLGTKNWRNSEFVDQLSLANHITANFPATYITDGNAFSFPDQGHVFANRLNQLGVENEVLFFDDSTEAVNHEYQFNFAQPQAQDNLKRTLAFLSKHLQ